MHWKAIFFDLDGTLVETAPEIADAVNDTLRHFGWPTVAQSEVDRWIGHGTRELLIQALARVGARSVEEVRQGELLQEALPVFDQHYQQRCGTRSQLYPHVRDTLAQLREHDCRLAVVTNKEKRYTDTVLHTHQLADAFDLVVSGDTFPTKKPDPAGVLHGLQLWNVDKADALFVGDSSIDAATARQAGIAIWLLPYGYNMGQPVTACKPDRVIADFSEIC
ncbi:phosphoglycolate phosphatase [Brachymonas denitrificans]|uniref:phosphoglycolate phosphatase n=1 Tax=Brachymonas denitrificans TaxID=28220 RepID=UPI002AFF9E85|nr:phosphoglycolate phosphatase [Brachymonas denitrificans]